MSDTKIVMTVVKLYPTAVSDKRGELLRLKQNYDVFLPKLEKKSKIVLFRKCFANNINMESTFLILSYS